jgi:hypothetical protein
MISDRAAARVVGILFAVGLAVSAVLLVRGLPAGDQLNLLARGWLLAEKGEFISYGNPMSTGGKAPGGITTVLVGLPLLVWRDHRAPTVVVLLFHVLAYWLLDRTLRKILSPGERVLFAVLYWLNPWRLYFSGFLWNPNYLHLFGAIHLWSCLGQRDRPRFWMTFLHAVGLVLAFQIHASFLLLAMASFLLWLRGYFKVHWPAAILGAVLAALPLVPWFLELQAHPAIVTEADRGFLGRGLVYLLPGLRGIIYWLRYSSLGLPGKVARFDFGPLVGGSDPWLGPALSVLDQTLLALTAVFPLLAGIWLWRRNRHRWRRRLPAQASDRVWLHGYVIWCFAASVLVFALAPTTVMYWQVVLLFHTAVLPLVLWAGALWRSRRGPLVTQLAAAWAAASILIALAVALGSPQYRCGGRYDMRFPLVSDSPMFDDLGIRRDCPWPMNRPGGWWPDVLPTASAPAPRTAPGTAGRR